MKNELVTGTVANPSKYHWKKKSSPIKTLPKKGNNVRAKAPKRVSHPKTLKPGVEQKGAGT